MTEPETSGSPVDFAIVSDGVVQFTLQRPPANPLGPAIIDGLAAALDAADQCGGRIIVIRSGLPGFFAAGADIKHMSTIDGDGFVAYGDRLRAVLDRLAGPDHISIAAVEGLALGGGLELAMACTLRVGGKSARLGLPEVKLGLIPGAGGTQRLPRLVGRGRALDIMLTGRQVPADEAHGMGLLDRLVDDGAVADEALGLAAQLRALSFPAQQAVIRTVDASFDVPLPEGNAYEASQVREVFENGEGQEGVAAFIAKRRPHFA